MTMSRNNNEPTIWLGCQSCYASGRLIGRWIPAEDAEDTTIDDVHRDSGIDPAIATTAILIIATILLTFSRRNQRLNAIASTKEADDWEQAKVIVLPTRGRALRADEANIEGHAWPAWGTEHWPQAR